MYAKLMAIKPDQFECFYDKDRSIISTFNLLKNAVEEYIASTRSSYSPCALFLGKMKYQ